VPTMAEAGLPAFKAPPIWFGLMGPGGMPRPVVDRIAEESAKTFADPKMTPRLVALGSVALPSTPEQLAGRIRSEMQAFIEVAKAADMKFED